MSSRLIHSLATTDALAAVFSDAALIQAMLDVESALARAEARTGVIPAGAAAAIERAAVVSAFDATQIAHDARASGTVSVPLVRALEARVRTVDADAARWVHYGATSQDVFDTALILCVREARRLLEADHVRVVTGLRRLSDEHAQTMMVGRTLLQAAAPTTFGLKAAGWFGSVHRAWVPLAAAFDAAMVLQFGGATGTLSALGDAGPAVERALASELGLAVPDAPWHAHRDRLVSVVTSAAAYTGALGKIARDVSLLMQPEIAEASEPGGASSSMPHKRNPAGCAAVIAAATRLPGLAAAMLGGMPHEHERGVGGWHSEGPIVTDAIETTGAAVAATADIVETLRVDVGRMRANVDATRGLILSERLAQLLLPEVGRERAADLVRTAVANAERFGVTLSQAVADTPALAALVSEADRRALDSPETFLGMAEAFRQRLLSGSSDLVHGTRD